MEPLQSSLWGACTPRRIQSLSCGLSKSWSSKARFFFNYTATPEIYPLSLHDALPICLIGTTTQYTFMPTQTYSNSYTFDAASNRTGFTAPDGSTNTYVYDTLNRLSTLKNSVTGQF